MQSLTVQRRRFTQPVERSLFELNEPLHPEAEIDREICRRSCVHCGEPRQE